MHSGMRHIEVSVRMPGFTRSHTQHDHANEGWGGGGPGGRVGC